MKAEPLDKLGRRVEAGAYLVYGHALGRSAGLRIGKVLEVKRAPERNYGTYSQWRIRVQGVDDDWSHREPELCKPGTLQFPERTIVIQERDVPAALLALLNVNKAHP